MPQAMRRLRDEGRPVRRHRHRRRPRPLRAGGARPRRRCGPSAILLRDYCDLNVEAGTRLIAEKGLGDIARFEKGDAFDRDEPRRASRRARRSAIVSGLYELFPDNAMVRGSLAGLAARDRRPAATWSTPASPGIRSSR